MDILKGGKMFIPKVSVIVPVYNTEKFLRKCILSLLNQSLKEIEIICVNDGSTDNSFQILLELSEQDDRIKIYSQENLGVSCARNKGLEQAKGEFIGFVDSDDYVSEDFFEKLYEAAKRTSSDIACGGMIRVEKNINTKLLNYQKEKEYISISQKYKACRIPRRCYVCNRIYSKQALFHINYLFTKGQNFEDLLWSHRIIAELGKVVVVPECYYYYNINSSSITQLLTEKSKNDNSKSNLECIEYLLCNKIDVNYPHYLPQKRLKIRLFNITILDFRKWKNTIYLYLLGILVLKISLEENW